MKKDKNNIFDTKNIEVLPDHEIVLIPFDFMALQPWMNRFYNRPESLSKKELLMMVGWLSDWLQEEHYIKCDEIAYSVLKRHLEPPKQPQ